MYELNKCICHKKTQFIGFYIAQFNQYTWNRYNQNLETSPLNPELVVSDSLQKRHNEHDGVSNHQPHNCLLNRLFKRRSKKTSNLRVTGLCAGNSPVTGEFPTHRASDAENIAIWWRHHVGGICYQSIESEVWTFVSSTIDFKWA